MKHFCAKSWEIFSQTSKIRTLAAELLDKNLFKKILFFSTILSCFTLIAETYEEDGMWDWRIHKTLNYFEIATAVIFLIEAACKSIKQGFLFPNNSYLRSDWWNVLDFAILVNNLGTFMFPGLLSSFSILNILRIMRILRIITHSERMKIILKALIGSFGAIVGVVTIMAAVNIIFTILGVNLMG